MYVPLLCDRMDVTVCVQQEYNEDGFWQEPEDI